MKTDTNVLARNNQLSHLSEVGRAAATSEKKLNLKVAVYQLCSLFLSQYKPVNTGNVQLNRVIQTVPDTYLTYSDHVADFGVPSTRVVRLGSGCMGDSKKYAGNDIFKHTITAAAKMVDFKSLKKEYKVTFTYSLTQFLIEKGFVFTRNKKDLIPVIQAYSSVVGDKKTLYLAKLISARITDSYRESLRVRTTKAKHALNNPPRTELQKAATSVQENSEIVAFDSLDLTKFFGDLDKTR